MQIKTNLFILSTLLYLQADAAPQKPKLLRVPLRRATQTHTISKRDTFYTTSLYNDAGSQYLIDLDIGTPAQTFTVTLDTGSSDLWVPESSCPASECPNAVFNSSQSSTFKSLNKAFSLTYGIGSVNGTYVTDTVAISGATVQSQQFGLASATQNILTNANTITTSVAQTNTNNTLHLKSLATSTTPTGNGILGLGYPKLTAASSNGQGTYNPFVFNLVSQGVISDPVFSIYMNNLEKTGWVGEVIFGGVDTSKYSGNLTYLDVVSLTSTRSSKKRAITFDNSNYYWMVGAQGISVTNSSNTNDTSNSVDVSFNSNSAFILDTGTTLTYLPNSMAKTIIENVVGSSGYTTDTSSGAYIISCSASSSTKQVVLKMKASSSATEPVTLAVPISELIIPLDTDSVSTASYCVFGIAPTSGTVGSNLYLVGDSFLRSVYMVFDMVNDRIGIASATGVEGSVQGVSSTTTNSGSIMTQHSVIIGFIACLLATFLAF
ncbi:aspartic peptidase domain-containing protein [Gilbertella persicaria]|nr:aspartic peptidase domain-containing protein [Gilbertella persicaria]KAI8078150.1 aspartic peptidase domain-containing protein [Gilbertella persicaria]